MTQPLNLDELFGQAKKIKVVWQDKSYELVRPEGLGPKEFVRWDSLLNKIQVLKDETTSDEQKAEELEGVYNDVLMMICPQLVAAGLPFLGKMRVLQFYMEEVEGKKAPKAESPSTGE